MFEFSTGVLVVAYALLAIMIARALSFSFLAWRHMKYVDVDSPRTMRWRDPLVSVLVPAFNEEIVLENCVASLLDQSHVNLEVIIIDDGSVDGTSAIARAIAESDRRVRYYRQNNEGKASAMNIGLEHARGEFVVSMDADSIFERETIEFLIAPFRNDRVGAVGGNVKVVNRNSWFGSQQAVEYVSGINLQRRSFASVGCMQVISGAVGAFRRTALVEIGGFSGDTCVEDMDVTIAMSIHGYEVAFAARAIAHTESPRSLGDWLRQRHRWTLGGMQVCAKYRSVMLNLKHPRMGFVGLPYFALFPWIDVVVVALFGFVFWRAVVGDNLVGLATFYALMMFFQVGLTAFSLWLDGGERMRLALLTVFDMLWYQPLLALTTVRSGVSFVLGHRTTWRSPTRLGANVLPTTIVGIPAPVIDLVNDASGCGDPSLESTALRSASTA